MARVRSVVALPPTRAMCQPGAPGRGAWKPGVPVPGRVRVPEVGRASKDSARCPVKSRGAGEARAAVLRQASWARMG